MAVAAINLASEAFERRMDVFIGGGGDDLAWLGLGVMRAYADAYARETGRPTLYRPNGRVGGLLRRLSRAPQPGPLNLIGHSWGGPDAYALAVRAVRAGLIVDNLITLDPVSGPLRRPCGPIGSARWLNVAASPSQPDRSDRLTNRPPWSFKPSRLSTTLAIRHVDLDLNHWNVEAMMGQSGARKWLDQSWRDAGS